MFALICGVNNKFVFANERYEHISGVYTYSIKSGEFGLDFLCGENNIESKIVNGEDVLEDSMHGKYNKLRFIDVNFKTCRFHEIGNEFFREFKNVQMFNLSDTKLETINKSTFRDAKKLEKLIASWNQLTEIPENLFSDSSMINYVDLSNNAIDNIDPLAFQGAFYLKTMNLSGNKLSELEPRWLPLINLLALDLSHNNLGHLNEHAFDELINLEHLDLSYNPIEKLKIGTFAYLQQLETLSLKHTDMSSLQMGTFYNQQKLVSLDLSENLLKSLDFEFLLPIFPDLQSFYLNENQLTDLSGFQNAIFPQLTFLDIRDNQFNCTYLRHFIESVDWTKLQMPPSDPQLINNKEPSMRGINCRNLTAPKIRQLENDLDKENVGNNDGTSIPLKELMKQIHDDNIAIMFLVMFVCICVLILVFLALFFICCRKTKL